MIEYIVNTGLIMPRKEKKNWVNKVVDAELTADVAKFQLFNLKLILRIISWI